MNNTIDIKKINLENKSTNTTGGIKRLDNAFPLMVNFKGIGEFKNMKILTLLIASGLLLGWVFVRGVDITIANQDTMLCDSALKSGNREYLKKCDCYYSSGDIACLEH